MRLQNVWSGRPPYYDRNAFTVQVTLQAVINGGGASQLSNIYTVPANRAAFLTFYYLQVVLDTAITKQGQAELQAFRQVGGVGSAWFAAVFDTDPIVLREYETHGTTEAVCSATDVIYMQASNSNTGGQCSFNGVIWLVEFDA